MKQIFILLAFLLVISATSSGQVMSGSTAANETTDQAISPAMQKKEQAFVDSLDRFTSGDYVAGEQALVVGNLATLGTVRWHCESGFMLLQMAFLFQSKADAVSSNAIAKRALVHLNKADQGYSADMSPSEIASQKEMIGYAYEKLLGDRQMAKAFYKAAADLSPTTGHAAELLAAIRASEAVEEQRLINIGKN